MVDFQSCKGEERKLLSLEQQSCIVEVICDRVLYAHCTDLAPRL